MTDGVLDRVALGKLLDVIGGDPEDFDELKQEFLDSVPDSVAALRAGVANDDTDALRIASHSLKGNAKDFGADRLCGLCATLEAQCKDGTLSEAGPQVEAIAAECEAAIAALTALSASDLS